MKLRYIGPKADGERAFKDVTGIEWMPGAEHEVADPVGAEMLRHPTSWERIDNGPAVAPAPKPYPRMGLIEESEVDDEMDRQERAARAAKAAAAAPAAGAQVPVVDQLDAMSDEAVRAYAKDQGLKINGIALTKGANLRAKVRAALQAKG